MEGESEPLCLQTKALSLSAMHQLAEKHTNKQTNKNTLNKHRRITCVCEQMHPFLKVKI